VTVSFGDVFVGACRFVLARVVLFWRKSFCFGACRSLFANDVALKSHRSNTYTGVNLQLAKAQAFVLFIRRPLNLENSAPKIKKMNDLINQQTTGVCANSVQCRGGVCVKQILAAAGL